MRLTGAVSCCFVSCSVLQLLLVAKADDLKASTKLMKGYKNAALANKGKLVFVTVDAVSVCLLSKLQVSTHAVIPAAAPAHWFVMQAAAQLVGYVGFDTLGCSAGHIGVQRWSHAGCAMRGTSPTLSSCCAASCTCFPLTGWQQQGPRDELLRPEGGGCPSPGCL